MRSPYVDLLESAFVQRSKALTYRGGFALRRADDNDDLDALHIDCESPRYQHRYISFDANRFVSVNVEHRAKNKPLRRLAKIAALHVGSTPEAIVQLAESTFLLTSFHHKASDEWWRETGQRRLEAIWLAIGT